MTKGASYSANTSVLATHFQKSIKYVTESKTEGVQIPSKTKIYWIWASIIFLELTMDKLTL